MVGINEFLGGKGDSRVERFKAASKGKSKEDVRRLEQTLLKPEVLPPFTGKKGVKDSLQSLIIKIVLPNKRALKLFSEHFSISKHVENSVINIDLLLLLLEGLHKGKIVYDKKNKKIRYKLKRGNCKRV